MAPGNVRAYVLSLGGTDAFTLLLAFVQFGFALRRRQHRSGEATCFHVVRSAPDRSKNLFVWDGIHRRDAVDALTAVLEYAKGREWEPRHEGTRRKLRDRRLLQHERGTDGHEA